jgi:hypothetical protein
MAAKFQSMGRRGWVFALMVLIGGGFSVTASAEDLGPPVGTKVPDIGTRLDQTGKPRGWADLARTVWFSCSFGRLNGAHIVRRS